MSRFQSSARWLAVVGVGGLVVWQSAGAAFGAAFLWSVLFLLVFAAALFATMFLLAPDGVRHITRHPDLLVPLGLLAGALGLLDLLAGWGIGLQKELLPVSVGVVQLSVSVAWLLRVLLHVLFATWMTVLVVEAVRYDRADLGPALSRSKGRFLRVLALLCPIWIVTNLLYAVEIPAILALGLGIAPVLGRLGVVVVWLALIGVLAYRFMINLATAALLPVAIESRQGFFSTLRRAVAESWQNRGRWWKLLLVQYLLMGAWITIHYHYSSTGGPSSSNTSFNFNCNYSAPWLGDYAYTAQWYSKAMGWLGYPPLALVVTLSALLSGLLSIVVKLAIVQRYPPLEPKEDLVEEQTTDPALVETLAGVHHNRQTPVGPEP